MNGFAYGSIASPFGRRFCVASDGEGLRYSGFESNERMALMRLAHDCGKRRAADTLVREAVRQARAYFGHRLRRFELPFALTGTPFQIAVWQTVALLEAGTIVSYADVARAIGHPLAQRGVAQAMGKTPLDLFIPAHRVIGADGRLKGAAGRMHMRRRLLAFEGIRLP